MAPAPKTKTKGGRSALADVVAREYTIHLHKRVRLSQLFRGYWFLLEEGRMERRRAFELVGKGRK